MLPPGFSILHPPDGYVNLRSPTHKLSSSYRPYDCKSGWQFRKRDRGKVLSTQPIHTTMRSVSDWDGKILKDSEVHDTIAAHVTPGAAAVGHDSLGPTGAPNTRQSRWDETDRSEIQVLGSGCFDTPRIDRPGVGVIKKAPALCAGKRRSRWDQAPMYKMGNQKVESSSMMTTMTSITSTAVTQTGTKAVGMARSNPGHITLTPKGRQASKWDREVDERNCGVSDDEVKEVFSAHYNVCQPSVDYMSLSLPVHKLISRPNPRDEKPWGSKHNLPQSEAKDFQCFQKFLENENGTEDDDEKFLKYPSTGGIVVTIGDIKTLNPERYLNDTIVDVYIKYIYYEKLPDEVREKTHMFSSYFYTSVKNIFKEMTNCGTSLNNTEFIDFKCSWTRNIDICSKDFIFVPVCENDHWFLAVICFIGELCETQKEMKTISRKVGNSSKFATSTSLNEQKSSLYPEKRRPCLCLFDSLYSAGDSNWHVAVTLKKYFQSMLKSKYPEKKFDWKNLIFLNSICPEQMNGFDCGLYLLQFVESFFESPIPYFDHPMPDLRKWFSSEVILNKRSDIIRTLYKLKNKL